MFTHELEDNFLIIRLQTPATIDDIHEILDLVEKHAPQALLLDLKQIASINSSLMGLLVRLYKNLEEIHVGIFLTGLGGGDRRTLKFASLDSFFQVVESFDEARKRWNS